MLINCLIKKRKVLRDWQDKLRNDTENVITTWWIIITKYLKGKSIPYFTVTTIVDEYTLISKYDFRNYKILNRYVWEKFPTLYRLITTLILINLRRTEQYKNLIYHVTIVVG